MRKPENSIDPPVAADADLRGFPFMPLHVMRLRDSDLVSEATGDEFRAAVLLWCASWHQVPAGSLPTSDVALARLAQYGRDVQAFQRDKAGALRGWYPCSDGRLYHPVIAALVNEAWSKRRGNRDKAAKRWSAEEKLGGILQAPDNAEDTTCYGNATAMPQQCSGINSAYAIDMEKDRYIDRDKSLSPRTPIRKPTKAKPQGSLIADSKPAETEIPADWRLGPNERGIAEKVMEGITDVTLDIKLTFDKFHGYYQSKRITRDNWHACWKAWVANAVEHERNRKAQNQHNTPPNGSAPPRYGQPSRPAPRPIPVVTGREEDHFPMKGNRNG